MRSLLLAHPHGPPFAEEAVQGFVEAGFRTEVVTSIGSHQRNSEYSPSSGLLARIARRSWIARGADITTVTLPELLRVALTISGLGERLGVRSQVLVDWVYRSVDTRAAALLDSSFSCVYGYEDGARNLFRKAAQRGLPRLYDLPIMHWRAAREVESKEAIMFPHLTAGLLTLNDSEEKHRRKDEELSLATKVIVASHITKKSLESIGFEPHRIAVIPYGISVPPKKIDSERRDTLRVLFVGRVGPRKGVHRLLAVWNRLALQNAELLLAGVDEFPSGFLKKSLGRAHFLGHRSAHELALLYQDADLLVLPSLVEGFGMVLLEALAHGTPILASNHTAAPDILARHPCGWSFTHGDDEALAEGLAHAHSNRAELYDLRQDARIAASLFSWKAYRQNLVGTVSEHLRSEGAK